MALCESSYQRTRGEKALQKIVAFISANTTGAVGTNCKALKPSRAATKNPGSGDKSNFELLMQKHACAYSACESRRKYVCDNEM